jgi:hypothetical protein
MLAITLVLVAFATAANAAAGCATGRSCDCTVREDCCTGTWYANCECQGTNSSDNAAKASCRTGYEHPAGYTWDCSLNEQGCDEKVSGAYSGWQRDPSSTACDTSDASDGKMTGAQCGFVPSPPSSPPSPPSKCLPLAGSEMVKPVAADPDPVNEPCYSHSSCAKYSGEGSGYVCCVKRGTCDNLVSANTAYYMGGCMGTNYAYNSSFISSTSSSDTAPSTVDGCVKQGECTMPYLEQIKDWTAGGGLKADPVSDAVMTKLLTGANEPAGDGGCLSLYPKAVQEKLHAVVSAIKAGGVVADYTNAVVTAMTENVANAMGVNPANVDIVVSAASRRRRLSTGVEIAITVSYATTAAATTGASTMQTAMSSTTAVATLLSTSALTVTVSEISSAPTATGTYYAPGAAPPPPAPSDGISVGVIIGAVVGAIVGSVIIVGVVYKLCKKPMVGASGKAAV